MTPLRLLVIEDSATVRKLVELLARRRGWSLESASTGAEGLELASRQPPDLILLDFLLPDMEGADVCARLAEEPRTAQVPVLVMTAKGAEILRRFERYPSVRGHLPKPFDEVLLSHHVRRIHPWAVEAGSASSAPGAPTPQSARLLHSVLAEGLAQIPAWEKERGELPAATYYAQRLLTPAVLRALGRQAAALFAVSRERSMDGSGPGAAGVTYGRAPGFSARLAGQQLPARLRHVLAVLETRSSLSQLATRSGLEASDLRSALRELHGLGLVVAVEPGPAPGRPSVVLLDSDRDGFAVPLAALLASLPRSLVLHAVESPAALHEAVLKRRPSFVVVNADALDPDDLQQLRALVPGGVRLLALLDAPSRSRGEALARAGFDGVLVKPVPESDLSDLFNAVPDAPRAQA